MVSLLSVAWACAALCSFAEARSVIAHFMAQNSYSYSVSDWTNDIKTAQSIGIEGFAVDDYETSRIADAYTAAEALGFKLLYSFDMSYQWSQDAIVSLVVAHASSPSTYLWKNQVLVSTYSGENNCNDFWAGVKSSLQSQGISISLAPAFTSYRDPSKADSVFSNFPAIDGFFNWWSWPDDVDAKLTTDTDVAYQSALKDAGRSGPYIMAVSPWQFKNLGDPNNWVELSDDLWNYRWQQALQVAPDIVEIVTWNDYAESHYIGDINPNVDLGTLAPNYVNGFVHGDWRIPAQYYIQNYKNNTAPSISTDTVVFWYRAHPKGVTCSTGTLPRNAAFPADAVFAMAILSSPATISLDIGSNHAEFQADAGVTMGSVPFPAEDSQIPYIQIIRNGNKIADGYGSMYVTNACSYYNFNPWVGSINA
ncbi:glycoside hydrolase [Gloeophyllum trabeum ATCC 11539]|uniref:Glycoside hydrolase n=1 Tax=Gloeophyllum trabeum (strain ATCC 11539 / FP-39264 / Madison 617) TaxID=670483 RepID=S7RPY8_GLOTA|nr:glycoside hydrolase [Gloeophyllum trabeum ATCC 11539]EPQ56645.1 glycoside hydrolase [Gloeophyllum trabeum ATCC 11539]